MDTKQSTPGAGQGAFAARGFDLSQFGMEVANEIGVNPANLGAYGLSEQQVRSYETQTHSGTQQGGNR